MEEKKGKQEASEKIRIEGERKGRERKNGNERKEKKKSLKRRGKKGEE